MIQYSAGLDYLKFIAHILVSTVPKCYYFSLIIRGCIYHRLTVWSILLYTLQCRKAFTFKKDCTSLFYMRQVQKHILENYFHME